MAKHNSSARKRESQKGGARRGRRGLRVLLLLLEAVMIAVLSVGCYAVNLLGTLERSDISRDSIYVYNGPSEESKTTKAEASTEQETTTPAQPVSSTADVTDATEWTVETEEATTQEQLDFLRTRETTDGYWNILLLGVDARKDNPLSGGEYRGDVIIICSINVDTKNIKMVSVYRDTVLKMYNSQKLDKATEAIFSGYGGSVENMISTINYNLDLNITDVVVVNWAAMALAVNHLGGLVLNITEEEVVSTPARGSIINGYLTEIVNNTDIGSVPITSAGEQLCDGPQTVAYCRNRYTTGNDFNRTGRQREVIEKMLEKAKTASLGDLIKAVKAVFNNIYTTLSVEEMLYLVTGVQQYTMGETMGFPEVNVSQTYVGSLNVADPVVADSLESNVRKLHEFLYGDTNYQPSVNVTSISEEIRQKAGL